MSYIEAFNEIGEKGNLTRFGNKAEKVEFVWTNEGTFPEGGTVIHLGGRNSVSEESLVEIRRIWSFKILKHNWDGEFSPPIGRMALIKAERVIRNLDTWGIKPFFVSPGKEGEVVIEYSKKPYSCEIWVQEDGSNEIYLYENSDLVEEPDMGTAIKTIKKHFR